MTKKRHHVRSGVIWSLRDVHDL